MKSSQINKNSAQAELLRACWHGLVSPSLLSLIVAVLTVLLLFVVCEKVIVSDMTSSDPRYYLAIDSSDNQAFITSDILHYASSDTHDKPAIALLGASSLGNAIYSAQAMSDIVKNESGIDTQVLLLTTGGQTIFDTIAALDKLQSNFKGIVVIDVNFIRIARSKMALKRTMKSAEFGFTSPAIDKEASDAGHNVPFRTGTYLWDNRKFTLSRLPYLYRKIGKTLVRPDIQYIKIARKINMGTLPIVFYQKIKHYDRNSDANMSALTRSIERIRANKDISIVLVEPPFHPRFTERRKSSSKYASKVRNLYERHCKLLRAYSKSIKAPYLIPSEKAGLSDEDFRDHCHLDNIAARRRYSKVLGKKLGKIVKKQFQEKVHN